MASASRMHLGAALSPTCMHPARAAKRKGRRAKQRRLSRPSLAATAAAALLLLTQHAAPCAQALAAATGRKEALIKKEYEESGDLGVVAVNARSTQRTMFAPPPLTISGVFKTFKDIASTAGKDSQERKRGLINKLLVASKENETGYIMRSLQVRGGGGGLGGLVGWWHGLARLDSCGMTRVAFGSASCHARFFLGDAVLMMRCAAGPGSW
jgi:hypothetical protein